MTNLKRFFYSIYKMGIDKKEIHPQVTVNLFGKLFSSLQEQNPRWNWVLYYTSLTALSSDFANTIKLIPKVALSFTPYPLFQWYLQRKEIFFKKTQYEMLKLIKNSIICFGTKIENLRAFWRTLVIIM
jgi:hypothetical protein